MVSGFPSKTLYRQTYKSKRTLKKVRVENKEGQKNKRKCRQKKIFSFFVELLSCPDTPHVVKLLRLFGVSHIDVSSDDKHGTCRKEPLSGPSGAGRPHASLHCTGLKLTAQHSINTTKTTTWTPALSYCTTDLFCFSLLLKKFFSLNTINRLKYEN